MIELRDYQVEASNQLFAALRRGFRKVVLTEPTGAGKRIQACRWAQQIVEKGGRLLVVTDRRQLVQQMGDECRTHGIPFGIIMGDTPTNSGAPVQIASIQTLSRRDWVDCPEADWCIVDEAHKTPETYRELMGQYPDEMPFVGLTATPIDGDGKRLDWDAIIEPVLNSQLIRDGYLLPTTAIVPMEPSMEGISLRTGEATEEVATRVAQCISFANVWEYFEPYRDKQFIAFTPLVMFARGLAEQFRERGFSCEVIEAGTGKEERKDIFGEFEDGNLQGLVSVDVLREGFDAPHANLAIDLQPNHSFRTYWQKVGRIKRPHEGQTHAIWLDFAGNFWRHSHPDSDPEWPTDSETTTRELVERKKETESKEKEPWSCPKCAYVLSSWEKMYDGKCPNCGNEMKPAMRRIIMQDGKMKTVSAKQMKKKVTDDAVKIWFSCLFSVIHSGKPLNLARVFYKRKTGHWPNLNKLPKCPSDWNDKDWGRRASDVFPELLRRK